MKTLLFGFGFEFLGFVIYFSLWGWIISLLMRHIPLLKNHELLTAGISIGILHYFVVSYTVIAFWGMVSGTGLLIWGGTTRQWLRKNLPWIGDLNFHLLGSLIFIIVFVVLRSIMFQQHPESMWYN